ncbi:MAG TPA: hypothetical protein VN376_07440, partial [Longilinea sp.]|nr:hypothetical protein [Longilinea sp.]
MFILIVYLFGSSASEPLASNTTWYVVLTQVVCLPFLFWILIAFFTYLPSWRDQTIHEYRSSSLALQKAGLGSAISLGAAGMVMIVFTFLNPSVAPHLELQCAGKYLAAGLLALLMNRVEKNVPYLVIPSQN